MKNKKISFLLVAFLIAIFAFGSVGIGLFANRASHELQTSVLKTAKLKKKNKSTFVKKLRQRLVAQAESLTTEQPAGLCVFAPQENTEYKGELITMQNVVRAAPGEMFSISIFIKNTGNTPWFGDQSKCQGVNFVRLGTAKERDRSSVFFNPIDKQWVAPNRIAMLETRVLPGEIATFTFTSKAPNINDIFKEFFQPVIEGAKWMESKAETAEADIYVGENDAEQERRLRYLNYSGQVSGLDLSGEPVIDVNLTEQKMRFKFGDTVVQEYTVSTGAWDKPTPAGTFKILLKQELRIGSKWPHYRMPVFQMFTPYGHGLHALPYLANDRGVFWNEALNHIGQRVSHGCVRLLPEDAEDLFNLTETGMKVVTHY